MSSSPSCDTRFAGISFSGSSSPRISRAREIHVFRGPPKPLKGPPAALRFENAEDYLTEEAIFLCSAIRAAGLDPFSYRLAPLKRRLAACLRALRVDSVGEASRMLREQPGNLAPAINTLLIGATSFFRDPAVFEDLESKVLPGLLARRPYPRIWSAACSDGPELYSIAMLLADHGALGEGHLRGTDFRQRAIDLARRGRYASEAAEAAPAGMAERYLLRGMGTVSVAPAIRSCIAWECEDLFNAPARGPFDMILCRNLAIYLSGSAVDQLWKRLSAALAPGGILVVGKAEKPRLPGFQSVGPCIYRKAA